MTDPDNDDSSGPIEVKWAPPPPAVFYGHTRGTGTLEDWPNSLTIEAAEGATAGDQPQAVALVLVDTNYKPDRPGQHPVMLTITDAVKAAGQLVATAAYQLESEQIDRAFVVALMREAQTVAAAVNDLQGQLLWELETEQQQED